MTRSMELHDTEPFQEHIPSVMWRHAVLDRKRFFIYVIENSSARHLCVHLKIPNERGRGNVF